MLHNKGELNKWKNDQVQYFKEYLKNFDKDSKQYNLIMEGLRELEGK